MSFQENSDPIKDLKIGYLIMNKDISEINYEDLKKLANFLLTSNRVILNGKDLSKYSDEELQESRNNIKHLLNLYEIREEYLKDLKNTDLSTNIF